MNEHIFLLFPNEGEAKEQFKEYIKIYKKLMKQGYDNVSSSVIINIMKFPNAYMRKMAMKKCTQQVLLKLLQPF